MSELAPPPRMRDRSIIPAPLNLTRQFALTGSMIMLVAMLAAGMFTAEIVSKAAIENTASATALLLDSLIEPLAQGLASEQLLPAAETAELNHLLGANHFKQRFPYLEIWKGAGLIAYSTTPGLVGRRFTPPPGLVKALAGEVSAQYTDLNAREHLIRGISTKYLEIYVPIREDFSSTMLP